MTDWDEMAEVMKEFRKATDEIKRQIRERTSLEREAGPTYDPLKIAEWMINDNTDYASASDLHAAARRHFPDATTLELNQAAGFIRDVLKGKLQ